MMSVFVGLLFANGAYADLWKVTKRGNYCPFLGNPIQVVGVDVVKEIRQNGRIFYQYKFIVRRPSLDNGWGISTYYGINYRLYYWAALTGTSPYASLYKGYEIWQRRHQDPHLIVIYSLQGLSPRPEPYYIRLGIIPYPMAGGYSCKTFIQYYRSDLKGLLDALITAGATFTGGVGSFAYIAFKEFAMGKLQDGAIDAVVDRMVTVFGVVVALKVYAKLPDIRGMSENLAAKELQMRTLKPYFHHYIPTEDPLRDGEVVKIEGTSARVDRGRVPAGTKVWYSVYRFQGGGGERNYRRWGNQRFSSQKDEALRAWLGTWQIRSHHTGGRFKGVRVISSLTIRRKSDGIHVYFGRPGRQVEGRLLALTPTTLTFRVQAGGNDTTATLHKRGNVIHGEFKGVHMASGQAVYGTYESY